MNLFIANAISLIAAVFTAKSSWARDRRHIYLYQVYQCLLLALASVFFNSYAGIVSLLACAMRNYLAATNRLTRQWTFICLLLVLIPGVLLNNRGYVGGIVLAANVLYTLGMYLAKGELAMKVNMMVNLTLWIAYEILILDIPSAVADAIALATAVLSLRASRNATEKYTDGSGV